MSPFFKIFFFIFYVFFTTKSKTTKKKKRKEDVCSWNNETNRLMVNFYIFCPCSVQWTNLHSQFKLRIFCPDTKYLWKYIKTLIFFFFYCTESSCRKLQFLLYLCFQNTETDPEKIWQLNISWKNRQPTSFSDQKKKCFWSSLFRLFLSFVLMLLKLFFCHLYVWSNLNHLKRHSSNFIYMKISLLVEVCFAQCVKMVVMMS